MDKIIDKLIKDFNSKTEYRQKKFKEYFSKLKSKSSIILDYSKIKIEIEKCKFDLNADYKKIGKYISCKYIDESVLDFTYDEI